MFNTIVPVGIDQLGCDGEAFKLAKDLQAAGAAKILIVIFPNDDGLDKQLSRAREAAGIVEKYGIAMAGIWVTTFSSVPGQPDKYFYVADRSGNTSNSVVCPLDEGYFNRLCGIAKKVCEHNLGMLVLDDDFRVQVLGSDARCFCDKHMSRYREELGEEISREELCQKIFAVAPNRYRDAWLKVNREALVSFCMRLRGYMDGFSKDFNIGLCAGPSVWWEAGDAWGGPVELVKILAGQNPPYLRLIGGLYWNLENDTVFNMRREEISDYVRRQAAYCKRTGMPCYAEGDPYPHMRHYIAASALTNFDLAVRCDGNFAGIKKYFYSYYYPLRFDAGYADAAKAGLGRANRVSALFAGGKAWGLNPYKPFGEVRYATLDGTGAKLDTEALLIGSAANKFLNYNNFPASFEEDAPLVVFGELARVVSAAELGNGAVLDYAAAQILRDRGVDTGIEGFESKSPRIAEQKVTEVMSDGSRIPMWWGEKWFCASPKSTAKVISTMQSGDFSCNGAYLYENVDKMRLAVLPYDMSGNVFNNAFINYYRQNQLLGMYAFIAGKPPLIACINQAYIYMIVKETADKVMVGVWNYSDDTLLDVRFDLGEEYAGCSFEYCGGKLEGKICTVGRIIAHDFCALVFTKKGRICDGDRFTVQAFTAGL